MTATEQLIAKQVSDVFPASVDDLPLQDAARRGLIAPLRCPARSARGRDQLRPDRRRRLRPGDPREDARPSGAEPGGCEPLPRPLRQHAGHRLRGRRRPRLQPRTGVPRGWDQGGGGLRADAARSPGRDARGLRARRDQRPDQRAAARRRLELAPRDRLHASRTDRIEARLPAAHRAHHAIHPRKEAGIVVDFVPKGATHNERVVSLHSLLDADFYREGARVTPAPRRRSQRRARRRLTPAPWLVPVTPDVRRRVAVIQREWQRVDPRFLDDDEQRYWATMAGRQIRFDERASFVQKLTEGRASKGALEQFLATCAAENPNRRLRMMALQDRVSMRVERADFDDLVTLVTQAPTWEKERLPGIRDPVARDRRGQAGRARPDPRALDVASRARDPQGAGPQGLERVSGGEAAARRARELARPPSRGERGEARARRHSSSRSRSVWRCSRPPRATRRARRSCSRRRGSSSARSRTSRSRSPRTCRRRSSSRTGTGAGAGARRSRRRRGRGDRRDDSAGTGAATGRPTTRHRRPDRSRSGDAGAASRPARRRARAVRPQRKRRPGSRRRDAASAPADAARTAVRTAGPSATVVRSSSCSVALAQEARQLRGEPVAGRQLSAASSMSTRRSSSSTYDAVSASVDTASLTCSLYSSAACSSSVSSISTQQLAEPAHERERRTRARRERDVVRHGGPQADRGDPRRAHASCRMPTMPVGPSYRDGSSPRLATSAGSVAAAVTGAARVWGTSASSEPSVMTQLHAQLLREVEDQPRECPPAQVRLDAEHDAPRRDRARHLGVEERVLGPVDLAREALDEGHHRARRLEVVEPLGIDLGEAGGAPLLREVGRTSEAPWPPSFQPRKAAISTGRRSSDGNETSAPTSSESTRTAPSGRHSRATRPTVQASNTAAAARERPRPTTERCRTSCTGSRRSPSARAGSRAADAAAQQPRHAHGRATPTRQARGRRSRTPRRRERAARPTAGTSRADERPCRPSSPGYAPGGRRERAGEDENAAAATSERPHHRHARAPAAAARRRERAACPREHDHAKAEHEQRQQQVAITSQGFRW